MKVCYVCGARPNFMKIAAVTAVADRHAEFERLVVHTGQHYDERMYKILFEDLELPKPDVNLEVGSRSHATQTALIMTRFEPVLVKEEPDLVLVVGDTNSTVACALVASKLQIPVAHVEAGLRSFDRTMPEELNRIVTDSLSDLLFVSEPSGMTNLDQEGLPEGHAFFVGNVMIDTLLQHRVRADASTILADVGIEGGDYAALTLHRPANVDDPSTLASLVETLIEISTEMPLLFPVHPRTRKQLDTFKLLTRLEKQKGIVLTEPLGYLDFLHVTANARIVLTDSGGIQEESTILRVPCLTLRENTERPATVDAGYNWIVGTDPDKILQTFREVMAMGRIDGDVPDKWDGRAGERIFEILRRFDSGSLPRR